VDQLQTFFNTKFYNIIFDSRGLMNRLSYALMDSAVVERFFDGFDGRRYRKEAMKLTEMYNCSMLDAMELATSFMEKRSRKEIWQDWTFLEGLVAEKLSAHPAISQALDDLIPDDSLKFDRRTDPCSGSSGSNSATSG
jgi:hypothetical protein